MLVVNDMKNKFYEANEELLKSLEGLTIEEIDRDAEENMNDNLAWRRVIMMALEVTHVQKHCSGKEISIDCTGEVWLRFDKFSLNLNDYDIRYDEKRFGSLMEAIEKGGKPGLLKAHCEDRFNYEEYGDFIQSLIDNGMVLSHLWTSNGGLVNFEFKESELFRNGTSIRTKFPWESYHYFSERFGV